MPIRRYRNGELALWQRRYWEHTIRDEADFARHVDYVHYNPVKHGFVARVCDWPYSSFHRHVRRGLLSQDWAGDLKEVLLDSGERRE
jgi:putative transposase